MQGKTIKNFFFLFGIMTIILSGINMWVIYTFGKINLLQIVWHIKTVQLIHGVDRNIFKYAVPVTILCCFLTVLWYFVLYKRQNIYIYIVSKNKLSFLSSVFKKDKYVYWLIFIICFGNICYSYKIFALGDIIKYRTESDFIMHNYSVPNVEGVSFEKKNNIIVISLESITTNLRFTKDDKTRYLPQLESLYSTYQHHKSLLTCTGTEWTLGALTAWFFGVPLKTPKGIRQNRYTAGNFLPNALSVFDVLKQNGYKSYMVIGTNSGFSGKNYLFNRGDTVIYDINYFREHNQITAQNTSAWGIFDFFMYDEAYKKYEELREKDEPFILFMESVDTHFPAGHAPEDKRKYNDIRDSWFNADDMLAAFIKRMEKYLDKDPVVILIIGDHYPMGEIGLINCEPCFNLFVGKNIPKIPESKLEQAINPMDIAPTILQAAGAKWNNDQFGLGISLFSEDKSFSETLSKKGLDDKLLYYSKFYDSFY